MARLGRLAQGLTKQCAASVMHCEKVVSNLLKNWSNRMTPEEFRQEMCKFMDAQAAKINRPKLRIEGFQDIESNSLTAKYAPDHLEVGIGFVDEVEGGFAPGLLLILGKDKKLQPPIVLSAEMALKLVPLATHMLHVLIALSKSPLTAAVLAGELEDRMAFVQERMPIEEYVARLRSCREDKQGENQ